MILTKSVRTPPQIKRTMQKARGARENRRNGKNSPQKVAVTIQKPRQTHTNSQSKTPVLFRIFYEFVANALNKMCIF